MTKYMRLQAELADCRHVYLDAKERVEAAEAALAAALAMAQELNKPCVWRVEDSATFQGLPDHAPVKMNLIAASCGMQMAVEKITPYCPYCGHHVEVAEDQPREVAP